MLDNKYRAFLKDRGVNDSVLKNSTHSNPFLMSR